MRAVSNTSPLLNLAIIGHLDLLRAQFTEVLIPVGVLTELRLDEPLPGSPELGKALAEGWLRVVEIQDRPLIALLQRTLDLGESEAITLAVEVGPDALLIDERDGRRVAASLKLPVIGALGVLLRAKMDGSIPTLQEAVTALEVRAGFRIAPGLVRELLAAAGEG